MSLSYNLIMKKIAFICIHNSCRSQMAEAVAKHLAGDRYEIYSAGTENYPEIKPMAKSVLLDKGYHGVLKQFPKTLEVLPKKVDVLITMGCGVECPFSPSKFRTDWGLDDPSGKDLGAFLQTLELIETRVKKLINDLDNNRL
jgi:arsenate reductase